MKEIEKESKKEDYARHYAKYKASYEKYRKKNKKRMNELSLKWHYKNRERELIKKKAYKNKFYFGGLRDKVLERDNWQCVKCSMTNEQHIVIFGRSITIDHIDGNGRYSKIPNNVLENLQTLCLRCHGSKDGLRQKEVRRKE